MSAPSLKQVSMISKLFLYTAEQIRHGKRTSLSSATSTLLDSFISRATAVIICSSAAGSMSAVDSFLIWTVISPHRERAIIFLFSS